MLSFLLVGSVLLLAAMSPGPDFVVVTKNASLHSRRSGIWTAAGVGTAVLIHATYSLAGLGFIVEHSLFAFLVIKWAGALYLAYLGIGLLRAKRATSLMDAPVPVRQGLSSRRSFLEGFGTNLLNPKAVFFFVGVFAQVVSTHSSLAVKGAYIIEAACVVGGWFVLLSWLLNVPRFKAVFCRAMRPVEKAMGALLLVFAVRLALERT